MIASTVRFQVSDYSKLSDYNWVEWLVKNKAANARFIFEEFVMIMKIHSENGETLLSSCYDFLKENEAERILFIEQIKRMNCIVITLMNWSQLIGNVKYYLQNRITSRLFYGRSIQMNNFRWTKLSV